MTTPESITCPACGLPWVLIAGAFPLHTSKGERCPMSGRLPASWPLPTTSSGTLLANPEAEELLDALSDLAADTEEAAIKDAPRKVRSGKGTKRGQHTREGGDPVPGAVRLAAAESLRAKRGQHTKGGDASVSEQRQDSPGVPATPGGLAEPGLANELATPDAEARHDVRPPTLVQDWFGTSPPSSTESTGDAKPPIDERQPQRKPRNAPPVYLVLPGAPPSYTDYDEACSKAEEQAEQNPGTTPFLVWEARPKDSFEKGIQRTRLGRVRKAKA